MLELDDLPIMLMLMLIGFMIVLCVGTITSNVKVDDLDNGCLVYQHKIYCEREEK